MKNKESVFMDDICCRHYRRFKGKDIYNRTLYVRSRIKKRGGGGGGGGRGVGEVAVEP